MREHDFPILNNPIDVSKEFAKLENIYFNSTRILNFNPVEAAGSIEWKRYGRKVRTSFNQILLPYEETIAWEFPPEYGEEKVFPFNISFISPKTIRIRMAAGSNGVQNETSLILLDRPCAGDSWELTQTAEAAIYKSSYGSLTITYEPMRMELKDSEGKVLTRTQHLHDTKCLINSDPTPFSFIRRAADLKCYLAATFSLSPNEKIYGCGESFTRLNKRGQKLVLWATDPKGVQTKDMYKPIPFFMSSNGYGMFVHTSAPLTFDFGCSYDGANIIYTGDDFLDLFIFLGNPKEILTEYTALTGRSPLPPLWSFGLWMSRITYKSETEVKNVAKKLRENHIPCDVIHLDTGWFETEWRCNYRFAESRFKDPVEMIKTLREMGFHLSLWQIPYFTPKNDLFKEAIEKGYVILDPDGKLPTEDAIIDFSNEDAVKWYQGLLKNLLDMGVEAIKADFGEEAPLHGLYASGKSGFYEHNLYPLRYNKAVFEITKQTTGNSIIWGRSAWAGSQRYPLHWGGDAENTDCGMAATLRGGLSLGLCGFSFWSHDIGGFVQKSPEELYKRWLAFGIFTSHSRCHGQPPKEPWEYGSKFMDDFRRIIEVKYRLMPYIYAQAKQCSDKGFPMMRTLFFEYPDDPAAWLIEDEYMFGEDILVAPFMEEGTLKRNVYLPEGQWIDYQTHKAYEGGRWFEIGAEGIPAVILVRDGSIIPHIKLAQCTGWMKWDEIELIVYRVQAVKARGLVYTPGGTLEELNLDLNKNGFELKDGRYAGKAGWRIKVIEGVKES